MAEDDAGATVGSGAASSIFGRAEPGMREGPVGIGVAVAEPETARALLDASRIPYEGGPEGIDVPPEAANGRRELSFLPETLLG